MSMNTEVIPGSPLYSQKYTVKKAEYKADLKLISAMCLQGLMSNCNFKEEAEHTAKCAIAYAKELLKQLEADNDN